MTTFTQCLFLGGFLLIMNCWINKLFPPGRHWLSNSIKFRFAWKSEDTRIEANRYSAELTQIAGILLLVAGYLSIEIIPSLGLLSFGIIGILFLIITMLIAIKTYFHIQNHFDQLGNPK